MGLLSTEDDERIHVPEISYLPTPHELQQLHEQINPSYEYGIDLFVQTKMF